MKKTVWFVLTPAGEAGPYFNHQAAKDAARHASWVVVSRKVDVADPYRLTRAEKRRYEDGSWREGG